jgi:L-amino acid N-acyltransferase YncA
MDGNDIGMGEIGGSTRLLPEAVLKGFVVGVVLVQDLDGNGAFEHQVAGTEYICHSARANALEELVPVIEKGA